MPLLNNWIDSKLADIANELPGLIYDNPATFRCGHKTGYKQALLDLEKFMNGLNLSDNFKNIYSDNIDELCGF
jgi:hypothetical protein